MIDDNFKVWLIEVNSNPCLLQNGPTVKLVPTMICISIVIL